MTILFFFIALLFAGICWKDLRLGLLILIAALPSYLLRFELFGVPSTLLELLIIAFILVWIIQNRSGIKTLIILPRLVTISILLFLVAGLIGIIVSPETIAAVGIYKAYFVEPILLFLILRQKLEDKTINPQDIFIALGITALMLSTIACIQWITMSGIPIPWDIERRVTSIFDYPNALGLYLGPIIVIAALKLYQKVQWKFWVPVFLLSSIAIVLSQSEAAIVSVIATLALAGLINSKTRKVVAAVIVAGILIVGLSPFRTFVFEKLTLQDYSGGVRLSQWEETLDMLSNNWLLGAGLSGYQTALEPYHSATHYEIFQYPHNVFLNIWTELGLLGLVAFVLLAIAVFKPATCSKLPITSLIGILATTQMFIHGLVDVPYFKNDLSLLSWILIAIALTYASQQTRQKKS